MTYPSSIRKSGITNPQMSDVHVNRPLTMFSLAWWNARRASSFASIGLCPVDKRSDVYWEWNRAETLALTSTARAAGVKPRQIGINVSASASFTCDIFGADYPLEDTVLANADEGLNLEQAAAESVTEAMIRKEEVDFAADFMASGKWGTDVTPGTLWSAAGSDPNSDVATGRDTILKNTGLMPNVLMVGHEVMTALKKNAAILNRLGLGGNPSDPRMVTTQALAALFEVERVIESTVVQNTAAPGAAFVGGYVVGKHALLAHIPAGNSVLTPSALKRFVWRGLTGSADGRRVLRWQEPPRTLHIEGEHAYKNKVTSTALGYFFADVVA